MATEAELQKRAHEMRRNPAEPEIRLWRKLSSSQLHGFKFRRQHVVVQADAILDFFCPSLGLAIEVDGDTHTADSDGPRDQRLGALGFYVFRVSNADVMANLGGVCEAISTFAKSFPQRCGSHPPPQPPLKGRG